MGERPHPVRTVIAGRDRLLGTGLPSVYTSFVGRGAEVVAATAESTDPSTRLVTFLGPGGVGKTRLALRVATEVADQFPDALGFASLEAVRSVELVPDAIRRALGIAAVGGASSTDQLLAVLAERRMLLVLDGFEHLLDASPLVSALVERCPRMTILVTSRARLRLAAERVHPVAPLTLPSDHPSTEAVLRSEAERLFLDRARSARDGFEPTPSEAPLVGAICDRLDGLPLAIELAAARMRVLSVADLAWMLERHMSVLDEGPRDVPHRLRSMRQSVRWSYDLLAPDRRSLLRRLAVFDGSMSLRAVETMAAGVATTDPALSMVSDIVDLSLMHRAAAPFETRFTMLETVREVMLEQLLEEGDEGVARDAHADFYRQLAEEAAVGILASDVQRHWMTLLEVAHPNIRAAIGWFLATGRPDLAARTAFALHRFWVLAGHQLEARVVFARVAGAEGLSPALRSLSLTALALVDWSLGDLPAAAVALDEAVSPTVQADDPVAHAFAAWVGTLVAGARGDIDTADRLGSESIERWSGVGAGWYVVASHWALAVTRLGQGRLEAAAASYRRVLELFDLTDDGFGKAIARAEYGIVTLFLGDPAAGLDLIQRSLAEVQPFHLVEALTPLLLEGVAAALGGTGDAAGALRLLGAADRLRERIGSVRRMDTRGWVDPVRAGARATLGGPAADAAIRAGRELSEEDAVLVALAAQAAGEDVAATPRSLSRRELEALVLVAAGRSDRQIAETLFISPKTASKHVAAAMEKLDAPNRASAAAIAIRRGLI